MKHIHKLLLTLLVAQSLLLAQADSHKLLQTALALENQGSFKTAARMARLAIDSTELSEVQLARAYIILGVAHQGEGNLTEAQSAFEQSLRLLQRDSQHLEDYASALENYAGLYSDLGQFEIAEPMWLKAYQLRQKIGEHADVMLSLTHLAGCALARNRIHEAKQYMKKASEEMKLAHDLPAGDLALYFETEGWLALAEKRPFEAVADYSRAVELCIRAHGEEHWLSGWEHMLRGKAYFQSGDFNHALTDMREGLVILDRALGRNNPKYFFAEIAYTQVLDRMGAHSEAAQIRATAEKTRKDYFRGQCAGCTISAAGFR